jgi:SNF2 family DNA or RNA helicase
MVVFMDVPPQPSDQKQGVARATRQGQEHQVYVYHYTTTGLELMLKERARLRQQLVNQTLESMEQDPIVISDNDDDDDADTKKLGYLKACWTHQQMETYFSKIRKLCR